MSDDRKCGTVSWTCGCKIKNHAEEGSPTLNGMTAWCYTHHQMLSACAYEWQTRALKAEKDLEVLKTDLVGVINTKNEIRKEAFERGLENGIFRDFVAAVRERTQSIPELGRLHQVAFEIMEMHGAPPAAPHTNALIVRLRDELLALDGMLEAHGYPPAGEGTLRSMIAAIFGTLNGTALCSHDWKDIRNKVIQSGEACFKCGALRAGNAATDSPKTI